MTMLNMWNSPKCRSSCELDSDALPKVSDDSSFEPDPECAL
jgi:hypothetical protein